MKRIPISTGANTRPWTAIKKNKNTNVKFYRLDYKELKDENGLIQKLNRLAIEFQVNNAVVQQRAPAWHLSGAVFLGHQVPKQTTCNIQTWTSFSLLATPWKTSRNHRCGTPAQLSLLCQPRLARTPCSLVHRLRTISDSLDHEEINWLVAEV